MKKALSLLKNNNFLSASFWVFLGTGFLNFGSYLYHLMMGRLLGPSSYGALEGAISVLYILFVPTATLSLIVVKFVSSYLGKKDYKKINEIYNYLFSKVLIFGAAITIILLLISPLLTKFLRFPNIYISIFIAITFLVNLFYILDKSVVQGLTKFFKFSFLNVIETSVKLFLGITLVYLGFSVDGAFAGVGIGLLAALFVSQVFVKQSVKVKLNLKADFSEKKELWKFAIPTFITTLALTSIFTTDIILVRHFFHGAESGYYSAISVLGKVIYFAASPVIFVVFPLASEFHAKGGKFEKFLYQGVALAGFVCILITSIYFLVPNLMVSLLFGPSYLPIVSYLGIFGVFISLYTICALIANFYLSIHKTTSSYLVLFAAILQIVLIILFHNSLTEVIYVSILSCIVLLISLLLYYPHAKRR